MALIGMVIVDGHRASGFFLLRRAPIAMRGDHGIDSFPGRASNRSVQCRSNSSRNLRWLSALPCRQREEQSQARIAGDRL
jgi:hypothetical protein